MDPKMLATMAAAGGGGAAPQRQHGGDIANQLMELLAPVLASPKGQMMAQALMQQMGGPQGIAQMLGGGGGEMPRPPSDMGPRSMNGLEQFGGRGGQPDMEMLTQGGGNQGPATDNELESMEGLQAYLRGQPPREMMPTRNPEAPPARGMSTEDELAMAQRDMGVDPADIKALVLGMMDPAKFDAKYGKGAAAQYGTQESGGDDGNDKEPDGDDDDDDY